MRSRLVLAVYGAAALWLAVVVSYLVYLLLPFGIGLLSTLFAALVALGVLAWLVRSLVWRPLRAGSIGRRRLATVLALAVATLTLDAGWTHYLVPLPPTDQDDCRFGSIGPDEFRALKREMAEKLNVDWAAIARVHGVEEEFEQRMEALLPNEASKEEMIAHIHAMARGLGAQFDSGGVFRQAPSDRDYQLSAWYNYKFDINTTLSMRSVIFRWARIGFNVVRLRSDSTEVRLDHAYVLLPGIKSTDQVPPWNRSCPPPPHTSRDTRSLF